MTTPRVAANIVAKEPTYTFVSAAYANEQRTAAVAITAEVSAVALSENDAQWAALLASGVPIANYVERAASDIDQAALNAMLIEDGSIMRAVVAVMRSEINIVRAAVTAGVPVNLPARTVPQITASLKAQMRS